MSLSSYEGNLEALAFKSSNDVSGEAKSDFSFASSTSQITCSASNGNILAVGGYEEVIRLYDLKT